TFEDLDGLRDTVFEHLEGALRKIRDQPRALVADGDIQGHQPRVRREDSLSGIGSLSFRRLLSRREQRDEEEKWNEFQKIIASAHNSRFSRTRAGEAIPSAVPV